MAKEYKTRVKGQSTSQGTGSYTLGSAVAGFATFGDAFSPGDATVVVAVGPTGWEEIEVVVVNATTLSRGTVRSNSLGNTSKIDWPDNAAKEIFCVLGASSAVALDREQTFTEDQAMGSKKLKFGSTGASKISGTDAFLRIEAARFTFPVETTAPSGSDLNIGDVQFYRASDTSLRVRMKGGDGTVREGTVTLS
jgi:hypothetical protein